MADDKAGGVIRSNIVYIVSNAPGMDPEQYCRSQEYMIWVLFFVGSMLTPIAQGDERDS